MTPERQADITWLVVLISLIAFTGKVLYEKISLPPKAQAARSDGERSGVHGLPSVGEGAAEEVGSGEEMAPAPSGVE